jgi:hypothetical protein
MPAGAFKTRDRNARPYFGLIELQEVNGGRR